MINQILVFPRESLEFPDIIKKKGYKRMNMNWKTWFGNLFDSGVSTGGFAINETPWGTCRICHRKHSIHPINKNKNCQPFGNPENKKIMEKIDSGSYDGVSNSSFVSGKNWLNNYVSSHPHSPYPVVYYHGVQVPHSSLTVTKTGR